MDLPQPGSPPKMSSMFRVVDGQFRILFYSVTPFARSISTPLLRRFEFAPFMRKLFRHATIVLVLGCFLGVPVL